MRSPNAPARLSAHARATRREIIGGILTGIAVVVGFECAIHLIALYVVLLNR